MVKKAVKIKNLGAMDLAVGSTGVEFQVNHDGKQFGDCLISSTKLTWCQGRTRKENGVGVSWKDLSTILNSPEAKKAALKAARAV